MLRKILVWSGSIVIVLSVVFFVWLNSLTEMEPVEAYQINPKATGKKVLIATQGSEYKDGLTQALINELKSKDAYIKVIDVTGLDQTTRKEWDTIIFMHAWEIGEPHESVANFIGDSFDQNTMFMITKADDDESYMEGIDGITGESSVANIENHTNEIIAWFNASN